MTIRLYKTCCFIGHRKIEVTEELKQKIKKVIKDLIINHNVDIFLFGSNSQFNDLCLEIVTELQKKYPHIKRVAYGCKSEASFWKKTKSIGKKLCQNIIKRTL